MKNVQELVWSFVLKVASEAMYQIIGKMTFFFTKCFFMRGRPEVYALLQGRAEVLRS